VCTLRRARAISASRGSETRIANHREALPVTGNNGIAADFSCKKFPRLGRFGLTELSPAG